MSSPLKDHLDRDTHSLCVHAFVEYTDRPFIIDRTPIGGGYYWAAETAANQGPLGGYFAWGAGRRDALDSLAEILASALKSEALDGMDEDTRELRLVDTIKVSSSTVYDYPGSTDATLAIPVVTASWGFPEQHVVGVTEVVPILAGLTGTGNSPDVARESLVHRIRAVIAAGELAATISPRWHGTVRLLDEAVHSYRISDLPQQLRGIR